MPTLPYRPPTSGTPVPPSQLRQAMRFILLELKGAGSIKARAVIDATGRENFGGYSDSSAEAVADSLAEATLGLDAIGYKRITGGKQAYR